VRAKENKLTLSIVVSLSLRPTIHSRGLVPFRFGRNGAICAEPFRLFGEAREGRGKATDVEGLVALRKAKRTINSSAIESDEEKK